MGTQGDFEGRLGAPMAGVPLRAQLRPRSTARLLLVPLFVVAAALFTLSFFLPWHHRFVFGTETYTTVWGTQEETWVLAGSFFGLVLAGLFSRRRPRHLTKIFAIFADVVMVVCLIIDYLDWQIYAASVNPNARPLGYLGPGFYSALGATALLIVTTVLIWRRL
jgi:hypothetical protein